METPPALPECTPSETSFNFLASLINGNKIFKEGHKAPQILPFNFLASLINGNADLLPAGGSDVHSLLLTS